MIKDSAIALSFFIPVDLAFHPEWIKLRQFNFNFNDSIDMTL